MFSPSRTRTLIAFTELGSGWVGPSTRLLAVVIGISTTSSWSCPQLLCPFRSSTPITVNGTSLTRTTWPTGSPSPKTLAATVCPISATLAAPSRSSWVNQRPATTGHCRASSYQGVVPWIDVDQLVLPKTTWPPPRTDGAAEWTAGDLGRDGGGVVLGDRGPRSEPEADPARRHARRAGR